MINFKLTHHAEDALVKRKIEKDWLERVLAFPQRIEPDATDPCWNTGWRKFPSLKTVCFVL
jgi:hypothetical protein